MEILPQSLDAYLDARAKMPGRIKRIGLAGETAFDFGGEVPLKLDTGKMRLSGVCSSEAIDGSRERVIAKGLDTARHIQNPIFTLNHNWKDLEGQIGRCEVNEVYTVKPGAEPGNKTPFTAQFFQHGPNAPLAEHAFAAADSGAMRGISIGFLIKPHGARKVLAEDGGPVLDIIQCELFEVTLVPMADNPDTIVRVVEKGFGGKPLHQAIKSILLPSYDAAIAESRKTVRGGYEGTLSVRAKAMTDPTMQDPNAAVNAAVPPVAAAPAQQPVQPPEQLLPASAEFCSEMNTYFVGLLRCLKNHSQMQEHPAVVAAIPELQLLVSEGFRKNQETYAALTQFYPDLPVLPGAGSLAIRPPEPPPPVMGAATDPALGNLAAAGVAAGPSGAGVGPMGGNNDPMADVGVAGPADMGGGAPEYAFGDGFDGDDMDMDDDMGLDLDADLGSDDDVAEPAGIAASEDDDEFADFSGEAEDAPTESAQKKDKKKDKKKKPAEKFKRFGGAMDRRTVGVLAAFDRQVESNVRTKSMQLRTDKICDAFWDSFGREMQGTDAGQLLRAAELLGRVATADKITAKGRAAAAHYGNKLREKAFGGGRTAISKAVETPKASDDIEAITAAVLAEISAPFKAVKDQIFSITGAGG